MKKVLVKPRIEEEIVYLDSVDSETPIFVKKEGKLIGMLVHEPRNGGWIIRLGGEWSATGHFESRAACIKGAYTHCYTFHIEE